MKKLSVILILIATTVSHSHAQSPLHSVVFAWSPNQEPDLAGYVFYERIGQNHLPLGVITPIAKPRYTINRLSRGTHFFSVTAFDNNGLESDFSHEVAFTP